MVQKYKQAAKKAGQCQRKRQADREKRARSRSSSGTRSRSRSPSTVERAYNPSSPTRSPPRSVGSDIDVQGVDANPAVGSGVNENTMDQEFQDQLAEDAEVLALMRHSVLDIVMTGSCELVQRRLNCTIF